MDIEEDEQPNNDLPTELKPLTAMISKMFSQEFVDFIKEKYGSVRDFYETSSATTQCNRTVGPIVRNVTDCWICGFVIPNISSPEQAFYPECEHIFPIAQALFFIGLYNNEAKDNPVHLKKLELEYGWAHRVCNQIKSDTHFIINNTENSDGRWRIDHNKIKEFLNDILLRGNKYGGGDVLLKEQMMIKGISRQTWIENRSKIINTKCQAIIDTIPPRYENLWMLTTVSDLALLYQNSGFVPEIISPYDTIAQSRELINYSPQEVISLYTALAKFVMKNVQEYMMKYIAERIGGRSTPLEERVRRSIKANEILKNAQLISILRQKHLADIYYNIPNDASKLPRFTDAIQYLILSVVLERIQRIFIDQSDRNSVPLIDLGFSFNRNIRQLREIYKNMGMQAQLDFLDRILSTTLRGASRKRR